MPGSELHADLPGAYKIKLRKEGYRLAYVVQDEELIVTVIAAGRREDNRIYEAAAARMPKPGLELKPVRKPRLKVVK